MLSSGLDGPGIGETGFIIPSKQCPDDGVNFVTCFTGAILGKKAPSPSNQVIVFLLPLFLSCAHFPGFDVLQSSLSQTARCSWPQPQFFSVQKNVHPGSACASLHKINTGSGVILYCLHMTWNKRCSWAVLLYGDRVVLGKTIQSIYILSMV